jgi:hypothetical protein
MSATTRFLIVNDLAAGTLKNATAIGAPVRNEFAGHPMENALNTDRRTPWYFDGGGGTVYYDIDMGAGGMAASGLFLHGLRGIDGGFVSGVNVYTSPTYYPAAVTWTLRFVSGAVPGSARDVLAGPFDIAGLVVARYWRVELNLSASPKRFRLGSLRAGVPIDLGVIGSPGMSVTPHQNRVEQTLQDGSKNMNTLGDAGTSISIPLSSVTGATVVAKLDLIAAAIGSVSYADENGYAKEVVITGGAIQRTRRFNDVYDAKIEAEALP